jgi:crotonobetainyl-CoA:carnitine CoA-transferase CaiB-like acyl-CoA transferase
VAPIGNGRTIPEIDHFVDQDWLVANPAGFVQPRRPYRFRDEPLAAVAPAPEIGATDPAELWTDVVARSADAAHVSDLPLAGVRVADFTAFWAGPLAAHILAGLGAEVIHVEGPRRPDGIRMNTLRSLSDPAWWEWSPLFCGANTNKRGIAVDLSTPEGHEIATRLLATCDVMIENFSPRVVEQLGLGPDVTMTANPRLVVVRMPAFGVSGPWRDRVGFAQTIEQATGLAFLTGYVDETPVMPNGMCDPIAGVHAAIAALVALHARESTGRGQVVETPMVGGALNTAAEQIVEYSAHAHLMRSMGNRSPFVAQEVLRCAGDDDWVAITLPDERSREALQAETGAADLDELARWCATRTTVEVETLAHRLRVPAARVAWAHEAIDFSQLVTRDFFEDVTHPVTGTHPYIAFPVRFSAGPHRWNRNPSPTLGGDNESVLAELGFEPADIAALTERNVIATSVVSSQQGW